MTADRSTDMTEQAAQAIRTLIHRTRPAAGALTEPAELAQMLAGLAELTGILPQLLYQLQRWLLDQHHHGRLRTDHCSPPPQADDEDRDAGRAVRATVTALTHAGDCLHQSGHALDTAHQYAAHLAVTDDVTADVLDVAVTEAGWGQR